MVASLTCTRKRVEELRGVPDRGSVGREHECKARTGSSTKYRERDKLLHEERRETGGTTEYITKAIITNNAR